jgi:hypothetical protein
MANTLLNQGAQADLVGRIEHFRRDSTCGSNSFKGNGVIDAKTARASNEYAGMIKMSRSGSEIKIRKRQTSAVKTAMIKRDRFNEDVESTVSRRSVNRLKPLEL